MCCCPALYIQVLKRQQDQEIARLERTLEEMRFQHENSLRAMRAKFLQERRQFEEEHETRTAAMTNLATQVHETRTAAMTNLATQVHETHTAAMTNLATQVHETHTAAMTNLATQVHETHTAAMTNLATQVHETHTAAMTNLATQVHETHTAAMTNLATQVHETHTAAMTNLATQVHETHTAAMTNLATQVHVLALSSQLPLLPTQQADVCVKQHSRQIMEENKRLRVELHELIEATQGLQAQKKRLEHQYQTLLREKELQEDLKKLRLRRAGLAT